MVKPKEFAKIMNVHLHTIYRWIEKGMPAINIGSPDRVVWRIDEEKAIEWLKDEKNRSE